VKVDKQRRERERERERESLNIVGVAEAFWEG
jgi:hypothetical protein